MATARKSTAARKATARKADAPVLDPHANVTMSCADGVCTITFRTDGSYPMNDSGKSWTVAKRGHAGDRFVTADGVRIQLNAFRVIPNSERRPDARRS